MTIQKEITIQSPGMPGYPMSESMTEVQEEATYPPALGEEITYSVTNVCDSCLDVAYDLGVINDN